MKVAVLIPAGLVLGATRLAVAESKLSLAGLRACAEAAVPECQFKLAQQLAATGKTSDDVAAAKEWYERAYRAGYADAGPALLALIANQGRDVTAPVEDSSTDAATPAARTPGETDPVFIEKSAPPYPSREEQLRIGGTVQLELDIGPRGVVNDVRVADTSGSPGLVAAAVETARSWRFKPATRNGAAVPSRIRVPVTFSPPGS